LREAHCAACHRHFGSPWTFDQHRYRGRCEDPGERRGRNGDPMLRVEQRANGPVWVGAERRLGHRRTP